MTPKLQSEKRSQIDISAKILSTIKLNNKLQLLKMTSVH